MSKRFFEVDAIIQEIMHNPKYKDYQILLETIKVLEGES